MDRTAPRGPSLAVIDTPPAPPGWEDARADLVRIVDPLGRAVAWLAPAYGGRCVGLAVRPSGERGTPWRQLFDSADPESLLDGVTEAGCGARCALVVPGLDEPVELGRAWRLVERDPTSATLESLVERDVPAEIRELAEHLALRFTAALNQESLRVDLLVENHGPANVELRLNLTLAFVAEHLRDAAGRVSIRLTAAGIEPGDQTVLPDAIARLGTTDSSFAADVQLVSGISRLDSGTVRDGETVLIVASAGDQPDDDVMIGAGSAHVMSLSIATSPEQRLNAV